MENSRKNTGMGRVKKIEELPSEMIMDWFYTGSHMGHSKNPMINAPTHQW